MVQKIAALSALLFASKAIALDPIIAKGSKFFYENGTQFFMKGIAYQEDPSGAGGENEDGKYIDPLSNETKCKRDVPILAKAGTNTIRVYAIDPTKDHDACLKLLQDAGIYVIADLGEPSVSINRDNPQWNIDLFSRYTAVVDSLAKYQNVIGYFAGNEVSNNGTNTGASAFVKAAVRDTKKYIKDKNYRWMGVGYAANDDAAIRVASAHYFNCGPQEEAIDFWGYNIYSWCGDSTLQKSGYDKQVDFFANYSVPVFLAEYGCNTVGGAEGRLFQDTTELYSDTMSHVFSGGIVYMYHQEENDYGLVKISNGKAETMKNYDVLASRVLKASASSTAMSSYSPTNEPAECPGLSTNWQVNGDGLPPTPDSALCDCALAELSCLPAANVKPADYGEIFGFICGSSPEACSGIHSNTTIGVYGAYSMCNDTVKLAWVMNEHFIAQNSASTACDFDGKGQIRTAPGAPSSCSDKLAEASSANAVAQTATIAPANTGSSGGSGNDDGSFGARAFSLGDYALGMYMLVATAVGGAMVML